MLHARWPRVFRVRIPRENSSDQKKHPSDKVYLARIIGTSTFFTTRRQDFCLEIERLPPEYHSVYSFGIASLKTHLRARTRCNKKIKHTGIFSHANKIKR